MSVLYQTSAKTIGGRDGRVKSDDGALDVALSMPKALGGQGGTATNPEQLFAAGYAACFLSATKLIAGKSDLSLPDDASVEATVGIGPNESGGFKLEISLDVHLPGLDKDLAQKLVDTAHQVCPYSNATRGNIDVKIAVNT
ncbi:organic hydroperoxide resistance protein [Polycladidibacter stylochi]|uniref:organic hydroperoxide resistance protein n=1 Tax=Polycladidibacter stylochi TaxID=1807766 RepID=UPI00082DC6C3|nr:organic hydroperoxide resistance protein [Pseudovibrio stylochi]